jgi:hypothetical protein
MGSLQILCAAGLIISLVVSSVAALATKEQMRTAMFLMAIGMVASTIKIALIQSLPQWHDTPPDSVTYWLHAKAIALHWSHLPVDSQAYRLYGLPSLNWLPNSHLTIPEVLGTREWIYPAYIASLIHFAHASQPIIILANGIWASFFPPAVFCIAILLGVQRRFAVYAGLVAAVDPMTAVNASHVLKDTITCFLLTTAVWAALILTLQSKPKTSAASACFVLATSVLYSFRTVSFLSILMAMLIVALLLFLKRRPKRCLLIMCLVVITWITSYQLAACSLPLVRDLSNQQIKKGVDYPLGARLGQAFSSLSGPIVGASNTLQASKGSNEYDPAVANWFISLQTSPLEALATSALRTLFAPYPWVAIRPGMNWRSFSEIYYPGMLIWISCLPFLLIAIRHLASISNPTHLFIIIILGMHLAVYTMMYGEFSTRQRVLLVPICFSLSALGVQLAQKRVSSQDIIKILQCK